MSKQEQEQEQEGEEEEEEEEENKDENDYKTRRSKIWDFHLKPPRRSSLKA